MAHEWLDRSTWHHACTSKGIRHGWTTRFGDSPHTFLLDSQACSATRCTQSRIVEGEGAARKKQQISTGDLLTLATGISSGFGCVLFPEGTSHDLAPCSVSEQGHANRSRSGSNSERIWKKCPVMQPVGLHFRVRHHYRTDMWVEFAEPYYLPEEKDPTDLIEAVQKREWVEPWRFGTFTS